MKKERIATPTEGGFAMTEGTERLFGYLNERAPACPKCGKKLSVIEIKMGFGDEIIGTYICRNRECLACRSGLRNYRRMLPAAVEKIRKEGILSNEMISYAERQRSAAMAAELRCSVCGHKRRYIESVFKKGGEKILHRFKCENRECTGFGGNIRIELTEADVLRIEGDYAKKNSCRICGKLSGAKVRCQKHGGYICMEHCGKCEFHDERTSQTRCRYFRDFALPSAARKGIPEIEKAFREAKEI
ncbi:MAG: hypothetical protein IJ306_02495 [Oscillospiraceae bacterium]|nr:hypothetical protein [Oscillospiraceae bacterium]